MDYVVKLNNIITGQSIDVAISANKTLLMSFVEEHSSTYKEDYYYTLEEIKYEEEMKLYEVCIAYTYFEVEQYMIVAEDEKSASEKATSNIQRKLIKHIQVNEIKEIDGYKITLSKS